MNKDLTTGNPQKVLWAFCLPLFGSVIFQQMYNIADSLIAGKYIGEEALAAVGNSYEITLIFIAIAFGCNIGCSVITSRYFGAGDYRGMKTAVSTSMISSAVVCAFLMLGGILFSEPLLVAISTPQHLLNDSKLYLDIYIWGLPFVFFYNISTGIFSALGDSKTPFLFLAASSTGNVAMDIIFVKNLDMKVAGVAWATFICQGISCILALSVIFVRLWKMKTEGHFKLFGKQAFRSFIVVTVPSMLQQSFISFGNIIIQKVINTFGSGVMAGYSAGVKLNNLVVTSFTTIGNGISNFTSQNIGAKKNERIHEGFKSGLKLMYLLSIPFCILYFAGAEMLVKLFLKEPSADAVHSGVLFLRILAPFYFIAASKLTADGVLRGATMMKKFMIATFTDLLIRVILAIILAQTSLGYLGIWTAWPIGWAVAASMSLYFYFTSFKKQTS